MGELGRLIIVDDEPVILDLLRSIFEAESELEVVGCATGKAALAALEQGVDVLLTDKNLPDIGGLELVKRVKQHHAPAEAIVITGYASLDTAVEALQLDAYDYIVKPPKDIFEVQRKVRQALAKVRMARENQRLVAELQQRNQELEHALAQLREVQAELIQSEKLAGIGTLAAGIAHEISSPLFGVMGLAEAIVEEEDRELVNGYAAEIVEYSQSIKEIVVQLSGYSRAAEHEYATRVDLLEVARDAVRLVTRSVGVDPESIRVEGPPGLTIKAWQNEIQQVFVNLVKNAVEATIERHGEGGGGQVGVVLDRSPKHILAQVFDNGPGIPQERLHAIFDPFYTTKPPGRGTGLGLNIVYRIVTKYWGTVSVDSDAGSGARFHLRFQAEST